MASSIFGLSTRDNRGNEVRFPDFAGKALLIVNTASKCGFTPQYQALESLHWKRSCASAVSRLR